MSKKPVNRNPPPSAADRFDYLYSFSLERSFLDTKTDDKISIEYLDSQERPFKWAFTESRTKFSRRLVFNFLSAIPAGPLAGPVTIESTNYYVVFDDGAFAFCSDAVPRGDGVMPAQYLFEDQEEADNPSTIKEYLTNLQRVHLLQLSKYDGTKKVRELDQKILGSDCGPLFGSNAWPSFAGCIADKLHVSFAKSKYEFRGEGSLQRYPLGEFAAVLPIPRFEKNAMQVPRHAMVAGCWNRPVRDVNSQVAKPRLERGPISVPRVVANSVKKVLEEATRILWNDGGRVVWIMGEPGSGKEVIAQALHHGGLRWTGAKTEPKEERSQAVIDGIHVQSVAGITLAEFGHRLFTAESSDRKCVLEIVDGQGGTVFLDEFDKPREAREIYSALLRVLEAKEFVKKHVSPTGERMIDTPAFCKRTNWIMAGAFGQANPREMVPPDLWSRLTGFIHLPNPLQEPGYGGSLFLYGYLKQVSKILSKDSIAPLMAAIRKPRDQCDYRELIALRLLGVSEPLVEHTAFYPTPDVGRLADDFQRVVNAKGTFAGDRLDTARGVLKGAEAAFNYLREQALNHPNFELTDEDHRESAIEEAHKALRLSRGPM